MDWWWKELTLREGSALRHHAGQLDWSPGLPDCDAHAGRSAIFPLREFFWKVTVHTFSSKGRGLGICLCHVFQGLLLHVSTADSESLEKSYLASQTPGPQ